MHKEMYPFSEDNPKAWAHYGGTEPHAGLELPKSDAATDNEYFKRLVLEFKFTLRGLTPERAACFQADGGRKIQAVLDKGLADVLIEKLHQLLSHRPIAIGEDEDGTTIKKEHHEAVVTSLLVNRSP